MCQVSIFVQRCSSLPWVSSFWFLLLWREFIKKSFNFSSSDLLLCSRPNGINCTENYNVEDCAQRTNSKFKNYGCKLSNGYETDYFGCSNRNDKKEVLFENKMDGLWSPLARFCNNRPCNSIFKQIKTIKIEAFQ